MCWTAIRLSRHSVLSGHALHGRGRWIWQWRTTWSTFCSSAHTHKPYKGPFIPRLRKQEWRGLSRTHAVLGRAIPARRVPMSGMKVRSLVVFSNHSALHRWSAQSAALLLLPCNGAFPAGQLERAERSRCPDSMVLRAGHNVAPLRHSSRCPWGLEECLLVCRHPITARKVSLMGSMSRVWALWHPGRSAVLCCWMDQG